MKKVEISIPSFVSSVPIKIKVLCDHEHEVDIDHIQKCVAMHRAALIESFEQLGKNLEKASDSKYLLNVSHKNIYCDYEFEIKLKQPGQGKHENIHVKGKDIQPSSENELKSQLHNNHQAQEVKNLIREELAKILFDAISHHDHPQV
jgi:hypothetical protein